MRSSAAAHFLTGLALFGQSAVAQDIGTFEYEALAMGRGLEYVCTVGGNPGVEPSGLLKGDLDQVGWAEYADGTDPDGRFVFRVKTEYGLWHGKLNLGEVCGALESAVNRASGRGGGSVQTPNYSVTFTPFSGAQMDDRPEAEGESPSEEESTVEYAGQPNVESADPALNSASGKDYERFEHELTGNEDLIRQEWANGVYLLSIRKGSKITKPLSVVVGKPTGAYKDPQGGVHPDIVEGPAGYCYDDEAASEVLNEQMRQEQQLQFQFNMMRPIPCQEVLDNRGQ